MPPYERMRQHAIMLAEKMNQPAREYFLDKLAKAENDPTYSHRMFIAVEQYSRAFPCYRP